MARKLVKVRLLLKPKEVMPWKTAKEVARITFSKNKTGNPVELGHGQYGKIFLGRIRFKDGTVHRVAIKRFERRLSDEKVALYKYVIRDLRNAGVGLPKMDFVKLPDGEWVQVSQLFGSLKKGSKIMSGFETKEQTIEALKELTKAANAGYLPIHDLIGSFKSGGSIPIDLDLLVFYGKNPANERIKVLIDLIKVIAEPGELKEFVKTVVNAANPEVKKEFLRQLKERKPG